MLELVEAIRLFLSVRGIICVVAADNEILRAAWRNKYPATNENEIDEYFDKIFQLKLSLPEKEQIAVSDFINNLNPSYVGDEEKKLIKLVSSNPRKIKQILNLIFFSLRYSKLRTILSTKNLDSFYPVIVTWAIISVLYPGFGNLVKKHPSSLNETLDFISLIKTTQEGFYKTSKVEISNEKLAEVVFRELNEFPNAESSHYLKQKSSYISMWSVECLKLVAEDFELFSFFWYLLEYLGFDIDFQKARAEKQGREYYLGIIEFIDDKIVHEIVKQIGLV